MSEIKYPLHLFGRDIVEDADNRPIVRVTHQGNAQTIVDALNTAAADREKLERVMILAERAYPGLNPSGLCSRGHADDDDRYDCTICFGDVRGLIQDHCDLKQQAWDKLERIEKELGEIAKTPDTREGHYAKWLLDREFGENK